MKRRAAWPIVLACLGLSMSGLPIALAEAAEEVEVPIADYGYVSSASAVDQSVVDDDEVPVSVAAGQPQSWGLMRLAPMPFGTVTGLFLELNLSDGRQASAGAVAEPVVVACPLTEDFEPGANEEPGPGVDCVLSVKGALVDETVWRFDLTALATAWSAGETNHGLAVRPESQGPADTWRLVFDAAESRAYATLAATDSILDPGPDAEGPAPGRSPRPDRIESAPPTAQPTPAFPPPLGAGPGRRSELPAPPAVAGPEQDGTSGTRSEASAGDATETGGTSFDRGTAAAVASDDPRRLPPMALILVPAVAACLGFLIRWPRQEDGDYLQLKESHA